jgi:hypothetical protein
MRIGWVALAALLATAACSSAAHPTAKSPAVATRTTTTTTGPAATAKPATKTDPATKKHATTTRPGTKTKPATTKPATTKPATKAATATTTAPATNAHVAGVNYAAKYLGLVAPLNAALDQLRKVPPKKAVPPAVLSGIAKASSSFGAAMLRVKWPGATTASDVRALVQANAAFSGDLSQINHQNAASIAAYRSQLARDDQATAAAAKKVRADLGLPPLKP